MSAYNILHITTCCIGEYLLLPLTVPVMSTHMLARTHLHHVEYTVPTNEHMYLLTSGMSTYCMLIDECLLSIAHMLCISVA